MRAEFAVGKRLSRVGIGTLAVALAALAALLPAGARADLVVPRATGPHTVVVTPQGPSPAGSTTPAPASAQEPAPAPTPSSDPAAGGDAAGDGGASVSGSGDACPEDGFGCWQPSADQGDGSSPGGEPFVFNRPCAEQLDCRYRSEPEDVGLGTALLFILSPPTAIASVFAEGAYLSRAEMIEALTEDFPGGIFSDHDSKLTDSTCANSFQSSVYEVEDGGNGIQGC